MPLFLPGSSPWHCVAGSERYGGTILRYLDGIATRAGLAPGLLGVLPEPWEREALEDGTVARQEDVARRAADRAAAL